MANQQSSPKKNILSSPALLQYIMETSAYPNEHEQLKELRHATMEKYPYTSMMNVPVDEAQLLSILIKLMNAKNTLEVGVFTGYSLLTTALALPNDAKIVAIDIDREAYEVGLPFIKKAGVEHKVDFVQGDALPFLNNLLDKGKEGTFDFVFVDADKKNYINYHETLIKLVKVGGLIAYDNTLWFGSIVYPDDVLFFDVSEKMAPLLESTRYLAKDGRIESSLLSVGDGVTLCRRKY
ncbi:flavonoid 3',5'-methyltransferase-like [Silene latifolia]|uniref:flavonoid 3',5'-methyltransferase-like n=1 Tax=Silene latifolia TaxID=37657 RepID=UPI003D77968A